MHTSTRASWLALALLLFAKMAIAQEIDTSAIDSVLTSVLDALTGTTGRILMTIVLFGVIASGLMSILDWSRVFWVVIGIVILGVVPTFVEAIWGAGA
ncbi:TrbC/VirB2 family protein [Tropicimonas isoalkanivorans]|uniref:TrbC/VIRB2 family protein n=1 Tax=Tropicimonas isoalkanivorans TaxID=441112 RepID=A0A1I1PXA6_9RHOB|nr:TrbC/VirB2 family protein [Tropicimonas isoalkanivorans]SFD14541.1 TrbC/VIRB2 family protein [Tropicimonas isoalkanivorans]